MNLRSLYYLLIAVVLLFSSCATPRMFTTIDVLRPAGVSFPVHVRSVLIVDNTTKQSQNLDHFTYNANGTQQIVAVEFDSAAIFTTAALKENLEDKAFFQSVKLSAEKENLNGAYGQLTSERISDLCTLYGVDALISLDNIKTQSLLDQSEYIKVLYAEIESKWSFHYPRTGQNDSVSFFDSFSWENKSSQNLPKRNDVLVDASIMAGYNSADRMIPRWEKQDRYLYNPEKPESMTLGMEAFSRRDWKEAIEHWSKAEEEKSVKTRFRAANNKAIAYELLGDFDNAVLSFNKAVNYYQRIYQLFYNETEVNTIVDYWQFLNNRNEELKLLNKQLGE